VHLFCKHRISDIFPILALVRSFAKHKFVGNDAQCEVIYSDPVILSDHNFRRHVARSARCVVGVVRRPHSRNAHVCDSDVAILIQEKIFWLNVSMDHALRMHIL